MLRRRLGIPETAEIIVPENMDSSSEIFDNLTPKSREENSSAFASFEHKKSSHSQTQ